MSTNTPIAGNYADFQGLARLRTEAGKQSPEAKREVAQQFEALFLQTMLKSMREAGGGDGLMDGPQGDFYRDMHDQQLAIHLSQNGSVGFAEVILRQLGEDPAATQGAEPEANAPTARSATSHSIPEHGGPSPAAFASALWTANAPAGSLIASTSAPQEMFALERTAQTSGPGRAPSRVAASEWRSPEDFVNGLWPAAEKAARELGTQPEALLAIAALETGWGRHVAHRSDGQSSNNLFGIKATRDWQAGRVVASTLEFEGGAMVRRDEPFRVYDSPADSVADFAAFIKSNPRYQQALETAADPVTFVRALHDAGYATDPNYANKLESLIKGKTLTTAMAQLKNTSPLPIA